MSLQDLAAAVILQAWLDAEEQKNTKHRIQARLFLKGGNKEWKDSLERWCEISETNPMVIMKKARENWR